MIGLSGRCARASLALASLLAGAEGAFSPVIGVLAMPEFKPHPLQPKRSYMAASYVKWLEAQGAHVVPLVHDAPMKDTAALLEKVNGILFPGGVFPSEPIYEEFSRFVFDTGVREKIPMWGECLGLLQFLLFTSGEKSPGPVSKGWDALGPPPMLVHLNITDTGKRWRALAEMPAELRRGIQHEPWVWHSHAFSVSLEAFEDNKKLMAFWDLLAVGHDRKGTAFVDIVQAKELPIFGLMWHPEKNSFEFMPERIGMFNSSHPLPARSALAMAAMATFSRFFVETCRTFRGLRFTQKELGVWSVHNWVADHTGPRRSVFEEIYYFPAKNKPGPPPITGEAMPLQKWQARKSLSLRAAKATSTAN